jgi:hypothetical protein
MVLLQPTLLAALPKQIINVQSPTVILFRVPAIHFQSPGQCKVTQDVTSLQGAAEYPLWQLNHGTYVRSFVSILSL